MSNKNKEPLDWNSRNRMWRMYPEPDRQNIILGSMEAIESVEPDISTERMIQMIIDTLGCTHEEVIEAMKDAS